ncbi:MAG: type II secretion system F family protein [Chlamydia sp.]
MSSTFRYSALQRDGKKISGSLEASSSTEAKTKLRETGLIILKLEDVARRGGNKLSMNSTQLTFFSTQLAQLLEANIPLFDSLEVLEDQTEGEKQQPLIQAIKEKIHRGCSFTEALSTYPETFSQTYLAIIGSGEAVGGIGEATRRIATLLTREQGMKNRIISALLYPMLLSGLLVLALGIMFFFVIPSIQTLFEDRELPLFTQIIFSCSSFVTGYWALFMVLFCGVVGLGIVEYRYPIFSKRFMKKALYWPLIGPFLVKSSLSRFSRTLATLLQGGTPLNIALEKSEGVLSNPAIFTAIQQAKERVLEGQMLSCSFKNPLFPKLFRRMIALGEETGRLSDLIEQLADLYEEETSRVLDQITSLIQPILLILFGLLIGSTLLAILLPLSDFGSLLSF